MSDNHDHGEGDAVGGIVNLAHRSPERETWHYAMMEALAPHFASLGFPLPLDNIKIGVGYTSSGKRRSTASIGECLSFGDGRHEITIRLDQDGDDNISHVLIHELIHAALPLGTGHKAPFRNLAYKFGLEVASDAGTACKARTVLTDAFLKWIRAFRQENGIEHYPHHGFGFTDDEEQRRKKRANATRVVRLTCDACGTKATMPEPWFSNGAVCCGNRDCDRRGHPMTTA